MNASRIKTGKVKTNPGVPRYAIMIDTASHTPETEASSKDLSLGSFCSISPVRLAVFDFDGTSLRGDSPVLLVRYLCKRHLLNLRTIGKILLWALAYKFRLPQNESWVRGLVFSAFEGWPKEKVDQFLADFYDEKVAPRFRDEADRTMRKHADAGDVVIVVSATFEPILIQAQKQHPFDFQLSTKMRVLDNNTYSQEVDGACIEGDEKLIALTAFADKTFGRDKWIIASAYGDHHSDRAILGAAQQAFAVDPDKPLKRTARKMGWPILKW